jgi:hypothetical protein
MPSTGAPEFNTRLSLAWWLAAGATLTELSVSGNLLTWLGDPYIADGGAVVLKIHPASYLAAAAAVARAWETGRPLSTVWRIGWGEPGLAIFLTCITFCILYVALMTGCCTLVVFVDTFLPAGLLAVALQGASNLERRWLLRLLQAALAVNATLAVIEAVTRCNWVPMYLNGEEYSAIASEFRPTALYDHPLTGASLTMIGLLLPFGQPGSRVPQRLYLALLAAGLLAFGGRAATCLTCLAVAARWSPSLIRTLLRRHFISPGAIAALFAAIASMPCLIIAAEMSGFGARLLGHLYWDDSAQVRLQQWQILNLLSSSQIIFGTSRPDLIALLVPLKLQSGVGVIENFWLLMLINLGLVGFPVFVAGLAALLAWCMREARGRAPFLVTSLILAASSSNSLGRKSGLLLLLVAGVVAARGSGLVQASRSQRRFCFRLASPDQAKHGAWIRVPSGAAG